MSLKALRRGRSARIGTIPISITPSGKLRRGRKALADNIKELL
jgi:hypothetical protein